MILIVTYKDDFTADFIVDKLNQKKIQYLRLNTEEIGTKHQVTFSDSELEIDGQNLFSSVWFRRTKIPNIDFENEYEKSLFAGDFYTFLANIWKCLRINRWLSHPEKIYKAENKLYQLRTARSIGFEIPKTIVSSSKEKIIDFYNQFQGKIIAKPINQGSFFEKGKRKLIFTNRVSENQVYSKKFIGYPIIFQEEVSKEYEIRVTVVNTKVFSAKVESQSEPETKTDWRRKKLKFESFTLPDEISKKCVELVQILGLNFGAIDIIKSQKGYVFLEINPNGQWAWIEHDTGLEISESIIDFLK